MIGKVIILLMSAFLLQVCRGYFSSYSFRRSHHISIPSSSYLTTTRSFAHEASSASDTNNKLIPAMPRGVKKENLPTKVCVVCERPFTWRKKWERCWDEVTTCSKSCNQKRKMKNKESSNAVVLASELDSMVTRLDNINVVDSVGFEAELKAAVDDGQLITEEDKVVEEDFPHNYSDDKSQSSQTSSTSNNSVTFEQPPPESIPAMMDAKAQRKAEKKRKKAERRAQREGKGDPTAGQKQCTLCDKSVNLLIRCAYDESGEWGMVCGKCWNDVSGGVVDGDDAHPHYRYGGLWKNRRAQT
mmetsp:Transcript_35362/g.64851  ORF Transcript_35362/g.64851 Transcript_35362/m.64851 type:complete len:300 (+) Transcript_35362:91-990(+)